MLYLTIYKTIHLILNLVIIKHKHGRAHRISASMDKTIRFWSVAEKAQSHQLNIHKILLILVLILFLANPNSKEM